MTDRHLVVVDDNTKFRQSLVWLLETSGYKVDNFGRPKQALKHLRSVRVDAPWCLLLDVRMPGMDGLDVHEELQRCRVRIPVVYMTGHGDVPLAVEAMSKGAVTFLEKPFEFNTLEKALHVAFNAQSQPVTGEEVDRAKDFNDRLASLTPRETEVMQSIVAGRANKVTAIDLDISVKTVEVHRARLMKKLGTRSGPELVRLAMLCR
jgi:two-component system response regulator FixJ